MEKEKQQFKHLSSNHPVIFFIQAITVVAVLFTFAFIVYLSLYKQKIKIASNNELVQISLSNINSPDVAKEGIDESMFVDDVTGIVEDEKIASLFPSIK